MSCDPAFSHSIQALDVSRTSTGQFLGDVEADDLIQFKSGSSIELFTYGRGDVLPKTAGFGNTKIIADEDMTNCNRGGMLTSAEHTGWIIVGLAARVGRVRVYDPAGHADRFQPWLDTYDARIREGIAEGSFVSLEYNSKAMRYTLGSMISRPLEGGIFGPVVTPDGDAVTEEHVKKMAEQRAAARYGEFVPFMVAAVTDSNPLRKATIKITIGSKHVIADNDQRRSIRNAMYIAVPVKVWLFGYQICLPTNYGLGE